MDRRTLTEFVKSQTSICEVAEYLDTLLASHNSRWGGQLPHHTLFEAAATVANAVPGQELLVLAVDNDKVEILHLQINRIELRKVYGDGAEPVIVDDDGIAHTYPSVGLLPDYDSGLWAPRIPVSINYLSLVLAINWVEYEYGVLASKVLDQMEQMLALTAQEEQDSAGSAVIIVASPEGSVDLSQPMSSTC